MVLLHSKPVAVLPFVEEVISEADREKDALGFLPEVVYREAAAQGKLIIATVQQRGQEIYVGHLLFGGVYPHGRIFQVHAHKQFRRKGIGRALIEELVRQTEQLSYLSLTAKVASDLQANAFWESMRFGHVRTAPGGPTRNRSINIRVRELNTPHLFRLQTSSEPAADLRLIDRLSTRAPQYVIDLNVMFDVVRRRVNAEQAGLIMKAGFNNLIRLAVTGEFIEELKRHSQPPDPILEFALRLPILPQPIEKDATTILSSLAMQIFPERAKLNKLTLQDCSDLVHLATAIVHNAAGFITSEKAILGARGFLQHTYGLDVVGVGEMAALTDTSSGEESVPVSVASENCALLARAAGSNDGQRVSHLLARLGVASQLINELSRTVVLDGARQILVIAGEQPIAFASWINDSPTFIQAFACADEDHPRIESALDHILDRLSRASCKNNPVTIRLRLIAGHTKTRTVAISHGFRTSADQPANVPTLQKISVGRCLVPQDWETARTQLKKIAGLGLPESMPRFDCFESLIEVATPSGNLISITLRDFETLLSPAILLLPGRSGAVVPIRSRFAADLFGNSPQLGLLDSPEARLLRERVYFSDPRTSPLLTRGKPILFYESGKDHGRSSVIAIARVIRTDFVSKETVVSEVLRRGVLNKQKLARMGKSAFLAATIFDNILHFRNPVAFDRLRKLGFHDPANLVTTRPISADVLTTVVREGEPSA